MSTPEHAPNHPAPQRPEPSQAPAVEAAPSPPERVYTPQPVPEPESVSPARAQEIEAGPNLHVPVLLAGHSVRVIPPGAWRQSWMRLLKEGDLDEFAERIIHPDDLDLYDKVDPTNDEFGTFIADASGATGESLGNGSGSSRSSRRTRRP